MEGGDSVGIVV